MGKSDDKNRYEIANQNIIQTTLKKTVDITKTQGS